jgi:hypothetical protein
MMRPSRISPLPNSARGACPREDSAPGSLFVLDRRRFIHVTREIDWQLFEKAIDLTASALRGAMGSENSQPPAYAGEVFRAVWEALKEGAQDLPERGRAAGFSASA